MNDFFQKISRLDKINIEEVKAYYDSFNTNTDSPDDEFAEYISCKKKIMR